MTTFQQPLTPESVTVSSTAVGITARPGGSGLLAFAAVLTVESNPIRYWTGGTDPTASVGILVNAGGVIELTGRTEINRFRAIRTGSDATLRVQPYLEYRD